MNAFRYRRLRLFCAAGIWLLVIASRSMAAPVVRDVNIRGLQIGKTTTLVIDGTDLLPSPRLLLSIPGVKQALRPNAKPNRIEVDVTIADSVAPGLCNLWVANADGVSEPTVIALDRLPQLPFTTTVKSTPVALHGKLGGSTRLRTTFSGKKGQSLILEVEAQRLGAKIRPVLHLYDSRSKQIAWSLPSRTLRGDARLQVTLPADGDYTAELHDLQYAAPAPNHFRLKIGNWQYADLAFPVAVERGKPTSVELLGNGTAGGTVAVTASGGHSGMPAPWSVVRDSSGPRPHIVVSAIPEIRETPAGKMPQTLPAAPVAVNGRLEKPGEQDRFQIPVTPGQLMRFEVFADRIGSPLDTALEIRNEQGGVLAANDDFGQMADSRIDYSVPANVKQLVVVIKGMNGRTGRRCIYRLTATHAAKPSVPDFELTFDRSRFNVPHGERRVVKVVAARHGYDGPIALNVAPLPPGIRLEGNVIPAGAASTLLTLIGSPSGFSQTIAVIRGTGGNPSMQRVAVNPKHPVADFQPWLAEELVIAAVAPSTSGFVAAFEPPAGEKKLVLGGRVRIPVTCKRSVGFDGPVRLTLLTNHVAPLVNGQPNPALSIRVENPAAAEIPVDRKAQVAYDAQVAADKLVTTARAALASAKTDKDKAAAQTRLRDAETKLAAARKAAVAASAAAKNNFELVVLVPADLAKTPYQVAIRAELLSRDKRNVLSRFVAAVRSADTLNPIAVALATPSPLKATHNPKTGTVVAIVGKISRQAGLKADVTVTLTGLPAGVPVPRAVVKNGQTDFRLEARFPAGITPRSINDLKVAASGRFEPRLPIVNSNSPKFTIQILPAPAAKK